MGARYESGAGTKIFVAIRFGVQHTSLGGIGDSIDIGGMFTPYGVYIFAISYLTFRWGIIVYQFSLNVILKLNQRDINGGRSKYMLVDREYIYNHITPKQKRREFDNFTSASAIMTSVTQNPILKSSRGSKPSKSK